MPSGSVSVSVFLCFLFALLCSVCGDDSKFYDCSHIHWICFQYINSQHNTTQSIYICVFVRALSSLPISENKNSMRNYFYRHCKQTHSLTLSPIQFHSSFCYLEWFVGLAVAWFVHSYAIVFFACRFLFVLLWFRIYLRYMCKYFMPKPISKWD